MGITELVAVLFIVLLFFGGSRLPALGAGLGKALRHFRAAASGDGVAGRGSQAPPGLPPRSGDDEPGEGRERT